MRSLWHPHAVGGMEESVNVTGHDQQTKIKVFARFRPKTAAEVVQDTSSHVTVSLPLHQRLAMIRASHNISSTRKAMQILNTQGMY